MEGNRAPFSQGGFSLIEVMIVAGIISISIMAMTQMITAMMAANKSIQQKQTANVLFEEIYNLLSNKELCIFNFGQSGAPPLTFDGSIVASNGSIPVSHIDERDNVGARKKVFQVFDGTPDSLYEQSLEISSLRIMELFPILDSSGAFTNRIVGRLGIGIRKPSGTQSPGGSDFKERRLRIEFLLESAFNPSGANTVRSCAATGGVNEGLWASGLDGTLYYNGILSSPTTFEGNVGIGTAEPKTKLDVAGGIRAGLPPMVSACNANTVGQIRVAPATGSSPTGLELCADGTPTGFAWVRVGAMAGCQVCIQCSDHDEEGAYQWRDAAPQCVLVNSGWSMWSQTPTDGGDEETGGVRCRVQMICP